MLLAGVSDGGDGDAGGALDGADDVLGGAIAGLLGLARLDGADDGAVLVDELFAVAGHGDDEIEVADEAGLEMRGHLGHELVSAGGGDLDVEVAIPLEEGLVALLFSGVVDVVGPSLDGGDLLVGGALGGHGGGGGIEDELHLVEVAELIEGEGGDEVSAEGHDVEEGLLLETPAGLADGGSAGLVAAAELGLGDAGTGRRSQLMMSFRSAM